MVETLWQGDVRRFDHALELICLVDQIHDFGVTHHRPFVMKHLEAWHAKHQATSPVPKEISPGFDSNDISNNLNDSDKDPQMSDDESWFDLDLDLGPEKSSEWLCVKLKFQNAKQEKTNKSRKRKRNYLEDTEASKSGKELQKRPRKAVLAPKRGRGRPRKVKGESAVRDANTKGALNLPVAKTPIESTVTQTTPQQ